MPRILLVTTRPDELRTFTQYLCHEPEVQLQQVPGRKETVEKVRHFSPHLVIIDNDLRDTGSLDLVRELLKINAMMNTAVISPLTDEQFHEASEGLGILCRLPLEPGKADARDLLEQLRIIL